MMIKMSEHASVDRIERLAYIATEIGIGEPVLSYEEEEYRTISLTDTGIVIIQDSYTKVLITAYVASIDRAYAMWHQVHGETQMPNSLYNQIVRNRNTHRPAVNEINKSYGYKYKKR